MIIGSRNSAGAALFRSQIPDLATIFSIEFVSFPKIHTKKFADYHLNDVECDSLFSMNHTPVDKIDRQKRHVAFLHSTIIIIAQSANQVKQLLKNKQPCDNMKLLQGKNANRKGVETHAFSFTPQNQGEITGALRST